MLMNLSIRDVVLIERLDLEFSGGLSVLTGETGAGKSILLDSLGLALGGRAEARLVRHGAQRASVSAEFDISADHRVFALLDKHDLRGETNRLLLRRTLGTDGRSRAFVNDQPLSVSLLRQIGAELVEVHGQFDNHRLLNPTTHVRLLDAHGAHDALAQRVGAVYQSWCEATEARLRAEEEWAAARRDEDYLRHAVGELRALDPQEGEEETLAAQRQVLMHGEKLIEAMNVATKALDDGSGVERKLRDAMRALGAVAQQADGLLDGALQAFDQAADLVALGLQELSSAANRVDLSPRHLEQVEERLFALRALARKHNTDVSGLSKLYDALSRQLEGIEDGAKRLEDLREAELQARGAYGEAATRLSTARKASARVLDEAVMAELEPLKLAAARFCTKIETLGEEKDWGAHGWDRVAFEVATNPGAPTGPLQKIASGGELSRFMLALKVVLARADPVPTLIFDEVDSGIGGKVADAVGRRLAKLGDDVQVLVVTHSPQVAARGVVHWHVSKVEDAVQARTAVRALNAHERTDEIARMLAGEHVTVEARAAAESLLSGAAR